MARSLREALAVALKPKAVQTAVQTAVHKPQMEVVIMAQAQSSTIKTQVQTITPALAKVWLTHNTHNRPMSDLVVKKYTAVMAAGDWKLNGESIIFANDGSLMSGQHRLQACVNADKSFQSIVTTGVDRATFATIDTHRRRGAADVLSIEGVKCANRVANVARLYVHILKGNVASRGISNEGYVDLVAAHPAINKWGNMLRKQDKQFKGYVFSALAHTEELYGADVAHSIYDKLVDGVGLTAGDPELALRNRLLLGKVTEDEGVALTIKAFNYSLEGRRVKFITYRSTEAQPTFLGL